MNDSNKNKKSNLKIYWGIEREPWIGCNSRITKFCTEKSSCSSLELIAKAWPKLQPHVREAIMTLIDAGLQQAEKGDRL